MNNWSRALRRQYKDQIEVCRHKLDVIRQSHDSNDVLRFFQRSKKAKNPYISRVVILVSGAKVL